MSSGDTGLYSRPTLYCEPCCSKIKEERVLQAKRFQIGADCREMNVLQRSYCFQLDYDGICNQEVQPVLADCVSAIENWDRLLPFEVNAQ